MKPALQSRPLPEFLSLSDLMRRYGGVSKGWITRRIENANFPPGTHIGGSKGRLWRRRDVEKWEANDRNHLPPPVNVGWCNDCSTEMSAFGAKADMPFCTANVRF